MVRPKDDTAVKRRQQRTKRRPPQQDPTRKAVTRPSDVYEAEEHDPQEEIKAGQRYDVRI